MFLPHNGFTLIELVVVVVILAILSAVAVPHFIDMTNDSKYAAVSGVANALNSALNRVNSQWLAANRPTDMLVGGSGNNCNDVLHINSSASFPAGLPDGANLDNPGSHCAAPPGLVTNNDELLQGSMQGLSPAQFDAQRGVVICARIFLNLLKNATTVGHLSPAFAADFQYGCATTAYCVQDAPNSGTGAGYTGCLWRYVSDSTYTIQYSLNSGQITVQGST